MGGQLLDVEQPHPRPGEHLFDGEEAEVGEVLVVDRVELVVLDQPEQVGELHRDHAARLEQDRHAADEVVEVRHVGQHVVAQQQVGPDAVGDHLGRRRPAEELDPAGHAPLLQRHLGHVRGRLHAQHGHAAGLEVLQQVAVVGRDLHHLRLGAEPEPVDHRPDVPLGVPEPAVAEAAEVGVLGEDLGRALELLQLDQLARRADVGVERVEPLHLVQLFGLEERVARRGHAQVGERDRQGGGTEAAGPLGHVPGFLSRRSHRTRTTRPPVGTGAHGSGRRETCLLSHPCPPV